MGYLTVQGKLLTYNDYKEKISCYKLHALQEFLRIYQAHKDQYIPLSDLHWGEELEYTLFHFDAADQKVQLANQSLKLLEEFNELHHDNTDNEIHLHPEFGNWMVEAVPTEPYAAIENLKELLTCYPKICKRRQILTHFFTSCSLGLTSIASPIILGTKNHMYFEDPEVEEDIARFKGDLEKRNQYSQSRFVIDSTENPHPRFPGLMKSIRERRGEKVKILIPIYEDKNTNMSESSYEEPYPGFIYMDSMHFGMGCSCLQVTFEAQTLNHARYLHDMMLPFTPFLSSLSASAPIFKGKLSNIDLRWTVISQSVDCRTEQERDPKSSSYIPKSRYSTMNHYLSNHYYVKEAYFDTPQYKVDPEHMQFLMNEGVDERLAYHIASLMVRDPIPAYDNEFSDDIDYDKVTAHFENLQSTNWNSMRFKPPPSKSSPIGWRVEFRPMDIQLTDFENAALLVLVGMLNNIVNHFDLNFAMPISQIDENMDRAHQIDAVFKQKFWFKMNILPTGKCYKHNILEETDYLFSNKCHELKKENKDCPCKYDEKILYDMQELYLYEILEGKEGFKGIYPLIYEYMDDRGYDKEVQDQIKIYLDFMLQRAKGEVKTGARIIRDFVLNHPDYKQDSIISDKIAYDLVSQIINISNSPEEQAKLFGKKYFY